MCFSAEASFGTGAVLAVTGVVALRKINHYSQLPFASIPLIFAIQQITEGMVWLSFSDPASEGMRRQATFAFLFFAQVVWPFWVPFSMFLPEKKKWRKKAEGILLITGTVVSIILAYLLWSFPVETEITGSHVLYNRHIPASAYYTGILYMFATILPLYISGIRKMWLLGTAILTSHFATWIFFEDYIISIWCFFAAIISIFIVFLMKHIKEYTVITPEND